MPRGCAGVTHLSFADDIVIFARGDRRSVDSLVRFLSLYQSGSGQRVNTHKSFFIASRRCGSGQIRRIQQLTGFRHSSFPFHYLGCNLYVGRRKKEYFQYLIDKFVAKLAGWKKKLLSQGGRLILIKHVLSAIPLHVVTVMDPPHRSAKGPRAHNGEFSLGTDRIRSQASLVLLAEPLLSGGGEWSWNLSV